MTRVEKSAGLILFRRGPDGPLYLLLKHPSYWGFPKEHVEDGESKLDTALRETEEEAGIPRERIRIIPGFKERIEYWFRQEGELVFKRVVFFLGETEVEEVKVSFEHEEGGWFPFDEALRRARYKNQRELLRKAHERVMAELSRG